MAPRPPRIEQEIRCIVRTFLVRGLAVHLCRHELRAETVDFRGHHIVRSESTRAGADTLPPRFFSMKARPYMLSASH